MLEKEERKSARYYNLIPWKTKNMSIQSMERRRHWWGKRLLAIRACCDSPISDVISRCYPPAGPIIVGTGGNKLAASHIVDNFPEWKLMYELKKLVICPRHRQKFACLRDQSGPTFDKHDKTQLLAKFKNILLVGFRATLNFRKIKVALNPTYRFFFKFCQKLRLIVLIKC